MSKKIHILSFVLEKFISAYLASLVFGSSIYLCMFLNQAFFLQKIYNYGKRLGLPAIQIRWPSLYAFMGSIRLDLAHRRLREGLITVVTFMSSWAGPAAELLPRLIAHHASFVFGCTVLWALTGGPVQ